MDNLVLRKEFCRHSFLNLISQEVFLSDYPLTEGKTFVLALGFNFQPRFPDLPIADIMAATEDLIEKIDTEVGQQLRVGVFNILHKVKVKLQRDKKGIL